MLHKLGVVGLLMVVMPHAGAGAIEAGGLSRPVLSFRGFGTVGVVHSSEKKADYTSSIFKPNGAGYTRDWSFDVDSRLGGQVDAVFTPRFSAVLQVIAEQRYDNSYGPTVEWANVKYQFTPELSARVGRIALPGLLASDYRKVGYALPWVRPPGDVYGLAQVTNNDGVDVRYRFHAGRLTNTLQTSYGRRDIRTTHENGSIVKARDSFSLVNTMEYDAATFQASYQQGRMTMGASAPLFDAFRAFGRRGSEIAARYDLDNKPYRAVSFGAAYDPGEWFVSGEWTRLRTNSWLGGNTGWYASGGYRLDQFTPYLIYSRVRHDTASSDPGVPMAGLPPATAAVASQLNGVLNLLLGAFSNSQETIAVGGRWDFAKNAALKVQYDHIVIGSGSVGQLMNLQPGFGRGGRVNVVSITVDFVF